MTDSRSSFSHSSNEASNEGTNGSKRSKVEFTLNSRLLGTAAPVFQSKSKAAPPAEKPNWTIVDSNEASDEEAPVFSVKDSNMAVGAPTRELRSNSTIHSQDSKKTKEKRKSKEKEPNPKASKSSKSEKSSSKTEGHSSQQDQSSKSESKKHTRSAKASSRSKSRSPVRETKKARKSSPEASKQSRKRSRSPVESSQRRTRSSKRSRSRDSSDGDAGKRRARSKERRSKADDSTSKKSSKDSGRNRESSRSRDDRSSRRRSRERASSSHRSRGRYPTDSGSKRESRRDKDDSPPSRTRRGSETGDSSKRKSKSTSEKKSDKDKEKNRKKDKGSVSPATVARRLQDASDHELEAKLAKMDKRGALLVQSTSASDESSHLVDWTSFAQELASLQPHHKNTASHSHSHASSLPASGVDFLASIGVATTLLAKNDADKLFEAIADANGFKQHNALAAFHAIEFAKRKQQIEAGHVTQRSRTSRSSISIAPFMMLSNSDSSSCESNGSHNINLDDPNRKQAVETLRAITASWNAAKA